MATSIDIKHFENGLEVWRKCRCLEIELAALVARNPTAHKWKATYRCIVLRELVYWRLEDVLTQVMALWKLGHNLGAVILLRSALETLAILIYLNQKMEGVTSGTENFFDFANTTTRLMLGSKNESTSKESINILSVLNQCDKKYPGILEIYADLSESAHPNYKGVCNGYSRIDENKFATKFLNRWNGQSPEHISLGVELCMTTFETEYNNVWPKLFERLEEWLSENDSLLEASKADASPV